MRHALLCLILAAGCSRVVPTSTAQDSAAHPVNAETPVNPIHTSPSDAAQILLSYVNTGNVELQDVATVVNDSNSDADGGFGMKLIGGTPADPKEWPASFTTSQGNSRCTGTVIGPRTLQLAAHCVGNGMMATLKYGANTYSGKCTHSPKYRSDATADYALCYLSQEIDLPWYEGILPGGSKIVVGSEIVLAGMGCTQPGGGGGNDNVFRVGKAPVTRVPTSDNDIVTSGSSALCFGDSGGSAFWKDEKGVLRIVGINSRGDIRKVSYLSAVYTVDAKSFYSKWATDNNASICGLDADAKKCRGEEAVPPPPPPPPSPVPEWCKESVKMLDQCLHGEPRLALSKPEECRDNYAKLYACVVASEREE
jgi:hypothetical protein